MIHLTNDKIYDAIIIGGGAAGMTAAIYTARKLMKTLVISVDIGGQNLLTEHEENYPGYTALSGPKLMQIFYEQSLNFGADFVMGMASKVEKIKEDHFPLVSANIHPARDRDRFADTLTKSANKRSFHIPIK